MVPNSLWEPVKLRSLGIDRLACGGDASQAYGVVALAAIFSFPCGDVAQNHTSQQTPPSRWQNHNQVFYVATVDL
jgi:hypothetical protein